MVVRIELVDGVLEPRRAGLMTQRVVGERHILQDRVPARRLFLFAVFHDLAHGIADAPAEHSRLGTAREQRVGIVAIDDFLMVGEAAVEAGRVDEIGFIGRVDCPKGQVTANETARRAIGIVVKVRAVASRVREEQQENKEEAGFEGRSSVERCTRNARRDLPGLASFSHISLTKGTHGRDLWSPGIVTAKWP